MDAPRVCTRLQVGRTDDPTSAAIDNQSVKTTDRGGPAGYDAGQKIKGRKRHLTGDTQGFPMAIDVHPADVQGRDGAPGVILKTLEKAPTVRKL